MIINIELFPLLDHFHIGALAAKPHIDSCPEYLCADGMNSVFLIQYLRGWQAVQDGSRETNAASTLYSMNIILSLQNDISCHFIKILSSHFFRF